MADWQKFIREPHRHPIGRVLGVYLVAAWGVLQVALTLHEALGLPDWVPPATVALLAIGLPIVLATSFVQRRLPARIDLIGPERTPAESDAEEGSAPISPRPRLAALLTWRRALTGGVAAFVLLALATTIFVTLRQRGTLFAQGALDVEKPVVLADFASKSGDPSLGEVVTEALRIDLLQSSIVKLAEPSAVTAALRRMQRDPAAGLSTDVALDLAVREGMSAVITGEVNQLGSGYVITSTVISADSGRTLAAFRVEARSPDDLIDAVDALSKQMRERIGESLKSIRAGLPLASATTSSLPALRTYTEGLRASRETHDMTRAVALMRQAVQQDPEFAEAWRSLGVYLGNLGSDEAGMRVALQRAYDLRDRLTEVELYRTTATYEANITRNYPAAIAAYRQLIAIAPQDPAALNNLGVMFTRGRRFAEAESAYIRAIAAPGAPSNSSTNLASVQISLGKLDEAEATLHAAREKFPGSATVLLYIAELEAVRGNYDRADSVVADVLNRFPDHGQAQANGRYGQADLRQLRGQFARSAAGLEELASRQSKAGDHTSALYSRLRIAHLRAAAEDHAGAIRIAENAVRAVPANAIPPANWPYGILAEVYALAGDFARADAYANQAIAADQDLAESLKAAVDAIAGRSAQAIPVLRNIPDGDECIVCMLPYLGAAYDRLGQPDSARVIFERFLTTPDGERLWADPRWRAVVLERVAALHAQNGDRARAAARYNEFIDLWKNADPELQPRVEAARARLASLRGPG